MIQDLIKKGKSGETVFISDVRKRFEATGTRPFHVYLTQFDGKTTRYLLTVPETASSEEDAFVERYLTSTVYNLLCALGAARICVYTDPADSRLCDLVRRLPEIFQLERPMEERTGFGKSMNVNQRILKALSEEPRGFCFLSGSVSEEPTAAETPDLHPSFVGEDSCKHFHEAIHRVEKGMFLGVDIGGSDIKCAVSLDGKLISCKEYDWNPSILTSAEQLLEPIEKLVRMMQMTCGLELSRSGRPGDRPFGLPDMENPYQRTAYLRDEVLRAAFRKHATMDHICQVTDRMQQIMAENGQEMLLFDGIGISFPDVVIRNRIVGGETPKTKGLHSCPNFEKELETLSQICERMKPFLKPEGSVRCINDGSMAAFTAALEQIAAGANLSDGFVGHSIGTDLGTGWVLSDGQIPNYPLEVYNIIIDLGSFSQSTFDPEDIRSSRNTITGLPGTLQRYASQSGIFRLAAELLPKKAPEIYQQFSERGLIKEIPDPENQEKGLLVVPVEPEDRRKEALELVMALASAGEPEICAEMFRLLGEYLAAAWEETEFIFGSRITARALFGRLVKTRECFRLITEGAHRRDPELMLTAADRNFAATPIMRQLAENTMYTVAQYGQAIGGIYFSALPEACSDE